MKSIENTQDWQDAELVHDFLKIRTNCFIENVKVVAAKYVVCIDDDPWSAVYAAWLFHQMRKQGQNPKVLCVGGKGLLSRWLKKKGVKRYTEGLRLKEMCMALGVPEDYIIVLDHGTDTGKNIYDIAQALVEDFGDLIFVVTQRLSLRFERSFKKQILDAVLDVMTKKYGDGFYKEQIEAPQDYYYVINQDLKKACCWMNGKRVGNCTMMYHELASILDRCDRYKGKFQLPLEFDVPKNVREASERLAKRYRIKLNKLGFREIGQYVYLLFSLKKHLKDMRAEQEEVIKIKQKEFALEFGITF